MKRYIEYGKKKCSHLSLRISPKTPFQEILARMEQLNFVGSRLSTEHMVYSVLELVNNSLRAHRRKNIKRPIFLHFKSDSTGFEIFIKDWGGGFDVRSLPYDLQADVQNIDIHTPDFETYRIENNYKKFGLGLYLARKTFPVFHLNFFDREGKDIQWDERRSVGTQIRLRTVKTTP